MHDGAGRPLAIPLFLSCDVISFAENFLFSYLQPADERVSSNHDITSRCWRFKTDGREEAMTGDDPLDVGHDEHDRAHAVGRIFSSGPHSRRHGHRLIIYSDWKW